MVRLIHSKYILQIILIVGISLLALNDSKASHAMGADLTYTCLGGNTYKVTLSFYRDCIGISAPSTIYVNVNSASCGENLGVTANPIPGTGQEVTQLCPTALSTCNGGVYTGIQEWIYEGIITLPRQCDDWVFSYSLCCRNAAITNITNPGFSTFFLQAHLDNLNQSCNSSPIFTNKPVPFACLGQEFCFNHGAYDPDGDSLVFSLIDPLQTASSTVNYVAPFSANQPLSSSPLVSFNALTGDVCMTPTALEVTVMAVLVQEYRNGVLIGSVERDIQVTVMPCTNTLPTLTGINGTNSFTDTICADEPYCFFINSIDPDPGQTVTISWDGGIAGATFTTTAGPRPDGNFCWTPSLADVGNGPHCFTAKVSDDNCPMFGSQIYSYCLTVIGLDVDLGPDQTIACNDLATITATASGGTGNYTYLWSNGFTNPTQTLGVGTYVVTVDDGECTAIDTIDVRNLAIPTAQFVAADVCVNTAVQFFDSTIVPFGVITTWIWNFGDGNGSTAQNPVHTYNSSGSYTVSLFVQTNLGCIDTVSHVINILPNPVAAFTANNVCVGDVVNFTDQSTPPGSINFWQWSFGDGNTSNQQNPSHTYGAAGTYQVTLIAGDTAGCFDTITQPVTIHPLPTADFSFAGSFCQSNPIVFTNLSTDANGLLSYYWTFGNGTTSNATNPIVTFDTTGTFNVTLVVTNIFGCTDTIAQSLSIGTPPVLTTLPAVLVCAGDTAILVASGNGTVVWTPGGTGDTLVVIPGGNGTYTATLTDPNGCTVSATVDLTVLAPPVINAGPDISICLGDSVTITANGGVTYQWDPVGTGGSTIVVFPLTTTTYTVTGIDSNGCVSTDMITVTVNDNPTVQFAPVFACAGSAALVDAGSGAAGYIWSNGATTQVISVDTNGVFTVTITDINGCTASGSIAVTFGAQINVNLGSINFCDGDSAVLDAGNPGMNYLWTPTGDTTQTITVYSGGTYGVTVSDTSGCSNTITTDVIVDPIPLVDFLHTDICLNDTVFFTNITTIGGGTVTQYDWNFGNGSFSQQNQPYYVYSSPGTYNVTLSATSDNGCVATITKVVNVYPLPNANFSAIDVCDQSPTVFTDLSAISIGNIIDWSWTFGDGNTSSQQNPQHTYTGPGMYNVTLVVTSAGGCIDSISRAVTVNPSPLVSFTSSDQCFGSAINFANTSGISSGAIASYLWNFGNGNTSSSTSPNYTYPAAGTYTATLIATSDFGCTDTASATVNTFALPIADAGANSTICNGDAAIISATGGLTYWWLETGDTDSIISVSPSITTTYHVTVTDINGCSAIDSATVFVNPLPNASAGPDHRICLGKFAPLLASGGGTYLWSTGSVNANVNVAPVVDTDYIVTITDANGCVNTDTVSVTIRPLPNIDIGPDLQICESATIGLTATGGVTYVWYPGSQNGSTIYINPGQDTMYHVFGIDSFGCAARDTVNITVMPDPVINLGPTFVCAGNNVVLDAGNTGGQYQWSNGSTTQTITVDTAGSYNVVVIASNGCAAQGTATVTFGGSIPANTANRLICEGDSVTLNAGAGPYTYLWSTGATTQMITVRDSGSYFFTITDNNGCSGTFQSTVTVSPIPVAGFTASDFCEGVPVVFGDTSMITSGSIISYSWDFGDGNNSNQSQPNHQYSSPGTYNVSLIVASGDGCSSSTSYPVTIDPKPSANFNLTKNCLGSPTTLSDTSLITGGIISSWNWTFGNGQQSGTANPSVVYSSAGTFNIALQVTSDRGCVDSAFASVTLNPLPVANFSMPDVCATDSVHFNDLSIGTISTYSWTFGDATVSSQQQPSHFYNVPGTYLTQLVVIDGEGCSDTISRSSAVFPTPTADYQSTTECFGDSTALTDLSFVNGDSIVNWYWTINNNNNTNGTNLNYLFNQSGMQNVMLVVETSNGCRDTISNPVEVYPIPQANFATSDVCEIAPVVFTDSSWINTGSISSYNWYFGDGNQSSQTNPTHAYNIPNTYNISLVLVSDNGCRDSITRTVNVFPQPNVNFSAPDVCHGNVLQFQDQTQIAGGSQLTYSWNFGDGIGTDTVQHPSYNYPQPGSYSVALLVSTPFGCTDTVFKPVDVHIPPNAFFNPNDACAGNYIEFIDSSNTASGTINGWNWTFGDGTNSSIQNPIHSYQVAGSYGIGLTVTTSVGCRDTHLDSLDVFVKPEPQITAGDVCHGEAILFSDTSNTALGNLAWDFGDGTGSNSSVAVHQYTLPGTYNVSLFAMNSFGCSKLTTIDVTVFDRPQAAFDGTDVCEGVAVDFSNLTAIRNGSIASYSWNFGDSTGSNSITPTHLYQQPGTYTVLLTAISDNGCIDSTTRVITINPTPKPGFIADFTAGCGPMLVQFTDTSDLVFGNIDSWSWDFGDGQGSNDQHPSHIYSDPGTYDVTLSITSVEGCAANFTDPSTVEIYPSPNADFDPEPAVKTIIDPSFHFENLSAGAINWFWSFGDGETSDIYSPDHTYNTTGTFPVYLIVTNDFGCSDSILKFVKINPEVEVFIPNAFTPNGDGNNDIFEIKGIGIVKVEVAIYDRWGERIFESNRMEYAWDGMVKGTGTEAKQDVYVYIAKIFDVFGDFHTRYGEVHLIK